MKQKKWKKWDEMKQEFSNESVLNYTVTAFCRNDLIKRFHYYSFFVSFRLMNISSCVKCHGHWFGMVIKQFVN